MTKASYSSSFWAFLAVLRFVLAFTVVISHLHWLLFDFRFPLKIFSDFGGNTAVIGFLIVSGLSVGHSYRVKPENYLKRRFLRIYPLYFAGVLAGGLVTYYLPSTLFLSKATLTAYGWQNIVSNLFFGQGFFASNMPFNSPLWTIAVEMFLYMLTPFLFRQQTGVLALLVIASMASFLFHTSLPAFPGRNVALFAWPWLIGFLISTRDARKLAAGFCILALGVIVVSDRLQTPLAWLIYLLSVTTVFFAGHFSVSKNTQVVLNFLGEISYPLYLFHFPIILALFYLFGTISVWYYVAATLAGAILCNYLFDKELKRRFWQPLFEKISSRIPTTIRTREEITR